MITLQVTNRILKLWLTAIALTSVAPAAYATSYYVDSVNGNDSNNGTSTSTPWKSLTMVDSQTFEPGDNVYFLAGDTWTGQLAPQGSGTPADPIVFSSYGSGAQPLIAGNGLADHAVLFSNMHDFVFNGFEVTNTNGNTTPLGGVFVLGQDVGALPNIYLQNLYVHNTDIGTDYTDPYFSGITIGVLGNTTPTYYQNLVIQDNVIDYALANGIATWSTWTARDGYTKITDYWPDYQSRASWNIGGPYTPSLGVIVRSNLIENIGAGGIVIAVADGALIEHNVVNTTATNWNNAGIWWNFVNALTAQFNDISNTTFSGFCCADGNGIDNDISSYGTVIQYNFSHDNGGGFVQNCCGYFGESTVRYNISQGDQRYLFYYSGDLFEDNFYNNTVYADSSTNLSDIVYLKGDSGTLAFTNNVFVNPYAATFQTSNSGETATYASNLYDGGTAPTDPTGVVGNPDLVDPGAATSIYTMQGYALGGGSPAIGAGSAIANNGNFDIFCTQIPTSSPDLGAVQTTSVTATATSSYNTQAGESLSELVDKDPTSPWGSDGTTNGGTFPGTITVTYSAPQTFSTVTLAAAYGVGQGVTNLDVQTWNGTAWVTQISGQQITWGSNTSLIEFRTINLPVSVTTTKLQLVIHDANLQWSHFAIYEIQLGTWLAPVPSTSFGDMTDTNIEIIADTYLGTAWASQDSPTFPGTIGLTFDAPHTISSLTLYTWWGVGQGITNFDVQTWNGTEWVTQLSSQSVTWSLNDGTIESRTVNLPSSVTTTQVQMVVHSANSEWSHFALNELTAQ